jgi:hypothetical protein
MRSGDVSGVAGAGVGVGVGVGEGVGVGVGVGEGVGVGVGEGMDVVSAMMTMWWLVSVVRVWRMWRVCMVSGCGERAWCILSKVVCKGGCGNQEKQQGADVSVGVEKQCCADVGISRAWYGEPEVMTSET